MTPWMVWVLIVYAIALPGSRDCKPSTKTLHNPKLPPRSMASSKRYDGSPDLVNLTYHMGPVLSSAIDIYIIWYGNWDATHQALIKDFLASLSAHPGAVASPSVAEWWRTVTLYTDQTSANVTRRITLAGEYADGNHSQGKSLTRLSVQQVIASAVTSAKFLIQHRNALFLVLTSEDVMVQDFCRAVCGFHYFTFPSIVGYTLPYAWVGNSGKQCPEFCAYPFVLPKYMIGGGGIAPLSPPNSIPGVDGMISVLGHELAEVSSNPLINAWYAGEDPTAPTEIADLCEGLYGTGGGGGFIGQVMKGRDGRSFNLNGVRKRRFLVQWVWNPALKACYGPNAVA